MLSFHVRSVGVYRFAQHLKERYPFDGISFTVRGLLHRRMGTITYPTTIPFFSLAVKGVPYEAAFDETRENWVVILEGIDWQIEENQRFAALHMDGEPIRLPLHQPVSQTDARMWRQEWGRLLEAWHRPVARNRLRVQLGVMQMLRFLLDQSEKTPTLTPAGQLREMIDEDTHFNHSLTTLSRRCLRNADHLRECFHAEFGMSPGTYRQERRLALAMDLVRYSTLSVKEIAAQLGFSHVSAFSAMFRKSTGQTVSQAIETYRHGEQQIEEE